MSEEDIKDKERSGLMYDKSKILEDYGQKADKLLRSIQKNFENDHTSVCVGAGSLAAIASVVIIALDKSEVFAIMLLVMGFTAIIAGIYLRLVSTKEQKGTEGLKEQKGTKNKRGRRTKGDEEQKRTEGLKFDQVL